MGAVEPVFPVKRFCGLLAASREVLDAAQERLAGLWGPVDVRSDVMSFGFTDYYEAEMGKNLLRAFVSFEALVDPGSLAAAKLQTNEIEQAMAERTSGVRRRVNLDPGYLDGARVVLASTKNSSQRLFLGSGIYGELTLRFRKPTWEAFDWTYADYRSAVAQRFLSAARQRYLAQVRSGGEARVTGPGPGY